MKRADDPSGHSGGAPSNTPAGQTGTLVLHGEDWTVGYGAASFQLRNILGLTYIQRLLQHPGEQFHALDLLSGTAPAKFWRRTPLGSRAFMTLRIWSSVDPATAGQYWMNKQSGITGAEFRN